MGTCDECERDAVETTRHLLRYFDDRDSERRELCAPCVRELRQDVEPVRSIT